MNRIVNKLILLRALRLLSSGENTLVELAVNLSSRLIIRAVVCVPVISIAGCGFLAGDAISRPPLITGHGMTVAAQSTQSVGDFPMNLIATPDGRFVISSDMGAHQSLWCIDERTGRGVSHVDFRNTKPGKAAGVGGENDADAATSGSYVTNGLYYGLAITPTGTLYAAAGARARQRCHSACRCAWPACRCRVYQSKNI